MLDKKEIVDFPKLPLITSFASMAGDGCHAKC